MGEVSVQEKYKVIQELSGREYPVYLLCKIAGVSRSGYYKWIHRCLYPSHKQLEDREIKEKILECHKKYKGIYGYRRVLIWLRQKYKIFINHKRIQRLMNELGIQAVIRKKRPYYGKREAYVVSDNHLNRDFQASKPNEKWVTDITHLHFNNQKLYLSVIKDLYNNEIVSYKISKRNDLKLVVDTIKLATISRDSRGVLLHSDQGFQYTSRLYNQLLKKYQIKGSMSRRGNCWDNACIENFFSHFKSECFNLSSFRCDTDVRFAIQQYIDFYNHERFQKKLNNLSPFNFRTQAI